MGCYMYSLVKSRSLVREAALQTHRHNELYQQLRLKVRDTSLQIESSGLGSFIDLRSASNAVVYFLGGY